MKGLWKQSGLAGLACADAGAGPGRSRRRARLVVYVVAAAFAALTAYVALSSSPAPAGAGSASWFDGVYASTAPYRSQVSTFFSSIFTTDSSAPSPGPSPRAGGSSRDGGSTRAESGAGSSDSATDGSDERLGSGGGAPSSNAGGAGAPPPPAGIGTSKSGSKDGGGAPANNPAAGGGAPPVSASDRNKGNSAASSSSQGGGGSPASSSAVDKSVAAKEGDGSSEMSGSEAPASNGAAENGSAVKADTKDSVGVSNNSSAGDGSAVKADSKLGSGNQTVTAIGAPSSGSAAENNTTANADGKDAVGAASNVSAAENDTVANSDLNNESDATHKSAENVSTVKSNAEDGGVQRDKASGNVVSTSNQTGSPVMSGEKEGGSSSKNQTVVASPAVAEQGQTSGASSSVSVSTAIKNETTPQGSAGSLKGHSSQTTASKAGNHSEVAVKENGSSTKQAGSSTSGNKKVDWIQEMAGCDMFHGSWVRDDSYPLYPGGSCPHIDEPFNCHLNGRPDQTYQKLRWQPSGCSIPRLNPTDMLERLRGKRLVFVGDSLNRNMWESLVCILRHSVKDKRKVFEASGRREFKTEGSYSFLFTDYNCSVEFFRSPFLVQEWETRVSNGNKKETLRLDIVEQSSPKYKDADIIIFNTGHWWTHEKTSLGKDYYQEGSHVYSELNVVDAFHKALVTWSRWIDANVNPKKTTVMFRGYSASHFSGGQWNSGGSCDKETEPIKNEEYLSTYPPKMSILEDVIHKMRTPVVYLNITRLTDYRKDAHPSVYRKQQLSEEERRSPERYQDCSHWCLPGVPDSWNELVYAQLLISQHQMLQQ
ncbi:unnamed protein product [Alopecurus aequalis]